MAFTKEGRLAITVGSIASVTTSSAFFFAMSPIAQRPGAISSLITLTAKPGFLGYVVGMFATGNAHAGGPLPVVIAVATIFNCGLYASIVYGGIRLFQWAHNLLK